MTEIPIAHQSASDLKTLAASRALSLPASKASIRRSDSAAQAASRDFSSGNDRDSHSTSISLRSEDTGGISGLELAGLEGINSPLGLRSPSGFARFQLRQ